MARTPTTRGPVPLSRNGFTPGKRPRADIGRFAKWLKVQRLKNSFDGQPITQKKLAHLVDMPYSRIVKLEAGALIPRIEWVEEFARFFSYDSDKLYLMIWELPPDMHWFLCGTKQGEKLVENIRKVMEKLPDPEAKVDQPKGRTNSEQEGQDHVRYHYFSRMDARIAEQKLSGQGEP